MAKQPRRGVFGAGFIFFLMLVIAGGLTIGAIGLFAPTRLALVQEHTLSVLHGGIADTSEVIYVDNCVQVEGADSPQAITRTRRIVTYRDGTMLEIVFSGPATSTNAQC
ncbi:hypothetical protein HC891_19845 [Candidatus Gracilibacteria bacterium]|nr:hypothetical protein [Candidatus Gracilibacteria bacterium]